MDLSLEMDDLFVGQLLLRQHFFSGLVAVIHTCLQRRVDEQLVHWALRVLA